MISLVLILAMVTALLVGAWLVARIGLAKQTASQDLLWRSTLVAVALVPALVLARSVPFVWHWSVPILPANASPESSSQESEFALADMERAASRRQTPAPAVAAHTPPLQDSAVSLTELPERLGRAGSIVQRDLPRVAARPSAPTWLFVLIAVWLSGSFWQCIRLLRAAGRIYRLQAMARPVADESVVRLLAAACHQVGLKRSVQLAASSHVSAPIVCGLFRPLILIPPRILNEQPQAYVQAALIHECAHIKRCDVVFHLLEQLVTTVFWPHPLVQTMRYELHRVREEICDNYVLAGCSPLDYAEALLELAKGQRIESLRMAIGILGRKGPLERRVAGILAPERRLATSASRPAKWTALGAMAIFTILVPIVRFTTFVAEANIAGPRAVADSAAIVSLDEEEAETEIDELLVERRDTLREKVNVLRAVWMAGVDRQLEGGIARLYLNAAAELADAELELSKTSAERIAACRRCFETVGRVEEVVRAKRAADAVGGTAQTESAARAARAAAEIALHRERGKAGELDDLQRLLVERRDALRENVNALRAVWVAGVDKQLEGDIVRLYLSAAAELADAELELSKTSAERIAACRQSFEVAKRIEEVVRAKRAADAEGGTVQAEAAARAARLAAEIALHRERIKAGETDDLRDQRLRELRLHRWAALSELAHGLRAVLAAGVDRQFELGLLSAYLNALADLGGAELDFCRSSAERVAVRSSVLDAKKRMEEVIRARHQAGTYGGTVQDYTTSKASRLEAEIELLRERIRGGYWAPAT